MINNIDESVNKQFDTVYDVTTNINQAVCSYTSEDPMKYILEIAEGVKKLKTAKKSKNSNTETPAKPVGK